MTSPLTQNLKALVLRLFPYMISRSNSPNKKRGSKEAESKSIYLFNSKF